MAEFWNIASIIIWTYLIIKVLIDHAKYGMDNIDFIIIIIASLFLAGNIFMLWVNLLT